MVMLYVDIECFVIVVYLYIYFWLYRPVLKEELRYTVGVVLMVKKKYHE